MDVHVKSPLVVVILEWVGFFTVTPIVSISTFVNNSSPNLDVFDTICASMSKAQRTIEVL
jgi:hypothetical protein